MLAHALHGRALPRSPCAAALHGGPRRQPCWLGLHRWPRPQQARQRVGGARSIATARGGSSGSWSGPRRHSDDGLEGRPARVVGALERHIWAAASPERGNAHPWRVVALKVQRHYQRCEGTDWEQQPLPGELRGNWLVVVGYLPSVDKGHRLQVEGVWNKHPTYGLQLQCSGYSLDLDASEAPADDAAAAECRDGVDWEGGMRRFLARTFAGVGDEYAGRLVRSLGVEGLVRLLDDPAADAASELRKVEGVSARLAARLSDRFTNHAVCFGGTVRAHVRLYGLGLSPLQTQLVLSKLGSEADEWITRDCYEALSGTGLSWTTIDEVGRRLGVPGGSVSRGMAVLVHVLRKADCDTGMSWGHAETAALEEMSRGQGERAGTRQQLKEAAAELRKGRGLVVECSSYDPLPFTTKERMQRLWDERGGWRDDAWVALSDVYRSEFHVCVGLLDLAKRCADMKAATAEGEAVAQWLRSYEERVAQESGWEVIPRFSEGQVRAVVLAATSPGVLITGGPGCGKTTATRAVAEWHRHKRAKLRQCAPTGRAAQRLQQASGSGAKTIHRLLKFRPSHINEDQLEKLRERAQQRDAESGGGGGGSNDDSDSDSDYGDGVSLTDFDNSALRRLQQQRDLQVAFFVRRLRRSDASTADDAIETDRGLVDSDIYQGQWSWLHTADYPLSADCLVADETSMLDVKLGARLLRGVSRRSRVVWVGDPDQLPPVGPGEPLKAAISCNLLPRVDLREVFRTAAAGSAIAVAARAVREGRMPSLERWIVTPPLPEQDGEQARTQAVHCAIDGGMQRQRPPRRWDAEAPDEAPEESSDGSAVMVELPGSWSASDVAQTVKALVQRLREDGANLNDIQVLTPTKIGHAGVLHLNQTLQRVFNPLGPGAVVLRAQHDEGVEYACGDRVLQTRNDVDNDTFNGDIGTVTRVQPHYLPAPFDNWGSSIPPSIVVTFDGAVRGDGVTREVKYAISAQRAATPWLGHLQHAFALTVHKSQGAEFPVVIVALHHSMPRPVLKRTLLYTAVSRASQALYVVGTQEALEVCVEDTHMADERRSMLQVWLSQAMERHKLPSYPPQVFDGR